MGLSENQSLPKSCANIDVFEKAVAIVINAKA
jgi:hypothetical protein